VDLAAVAAKVVAAQNASSQHHVTVEGRATAWADEGRVRQILRHLVGNAVKFTPPGGAVRVMVAPGAVVTVSDSGPGMSEEERQRVLEPFEQARSGYAREASGAGLGLALVSRLVELQGGTLRLESEPGQGTQVTFTLPAERTNA
jgi:signal transduction histidine kinase